MPEKCTNIGVYMETSAPTLPISLLIWHTTCFI